MHLVTADEMREMDRQAIAVFGLPGRVLMENAGRGAARILLRTFPDIASKSVAIVAGRGNNGGDGFVIARYLAHAGVSVTVYLLSERDRLSGDAADNFNLLEALKISVKEIIREETFNLLKPKMGGHDIWVDAILGTGLNADVREFFSAIIRFINASKKFVLSVDIPSGLHADSGNPCGISIRADMTVSFAFPKVGHIQLPGADYTGDLHIIDIGIPPHIVENVAPKNHLTTAETANALIQPRPCDMHKGGTGHVLVIAGSPGKTGAAVMSAVSVLRSGAGLVTLGIPKGLHSVVASQSLEVMTIALPETETGTHTCDAAEKILDLTHGKKCLVIGPGMGTDEKTKELLIRLIRQSPVPMVIDADGINNLAGNTDILSQRKSDTILTPHPGEMGRLLGISPQAVQEKRIDLAREFATRYQVYLILKGARTVIACPDGHVYINPTGNPGMASAGMGDVLTGMVAGFVSQGYPLHAAAILAVYLHGDAADTLADSKQPYAYLASDVIHKIPEAIGGLAGKSAFSPSPVYSPPVTELL